MYIVSTNLLFKKEEFSITHESLIHETRFSAGKVVIETERFERTEYDGMVIWSKKVSEYSAVSCKEDLAKELEENYQKDLSILLYSNQAIA